MKAENYRKEKKKSFAEVSKGLRGIFERSWSWMKVEHWRKETMGWKEMG